MWRHRVRPSVAHVIVQLELGLGVVSNLKGLILKNVGHERETRLLWQPQTWSSSWLTSWTPKVVGNNLLGATCSTILDRQQALEGLDRDWHILHMCRYGRAYKKPTVFFSFGGLKLPSLNRRCTTEDSCGRAYHLQLGFGDLSTHDAAVYPRQLCAAYAADLRRDADRRQLALSARDRLVSTSVGHVERHVDRGISAKSARVRRDAEDRESRAGASQL